MEIKSNKTLFNPEIHHHSLRTKEDEIRLGYVCNCSHCDRCKERIKKEQQQRGITYDRFLLEILR